MTDNIDIEEHSVFDNPQIFPYIAKLKQEIDEDAPLVTRNLLQQDTKGTSKPMDARQLTTNIHIGHTNTSKYNANFYRNYMNILKDVNNEQQNIQQNPEISNIKLEQEQITKYKEDYHLVPKREILHCTVCSNESEEEMCKQCVKESADRLPISSPFAKTIAENTSALDKCTYTSGENRSVEQQTRKMNYVCDYCEYKCITKHYLILHLSKHTGEKPYKCKYCSVKFSFIQSLKYHIRVKHTNDKNYLCGFCEYKCVTKSKLNIHVRKHTGEKPYKCELCDNRFSESFTLKIHVKAKHTNERNYSCDVCEYKCVTKSTLIIHLRKHTGEKPYKCEICDHKFTDRSKLKIHIKAKHTNEKNYSCYYCEYKCVAKHYLTAHLQKHTGVKPYKCGLCGDIFSENRRLKIHIKSKHTNEMNYSCDFCEYKCVAKSKLDVHIRKHTGEKPYKCESCGNKFSKSGTLKIHIRAIHTNEKNYSCDICDYKFVTKYQLNVHIRKHTGEKPYKCELCDDTFSVNTKLKVHIKSKHTNEKNYSCDFCQYKCVAKRYLTAHLQTHTGVKAHKCEFCEDRFSASRYLKKHILYKHK